MKLNKWRDRNYWNAFHEAEHVTLLQSGEEFFNTLLALIGSAKESLHIQMYILNDDNIGMMMLEALEQASKRGIEIFVVADGFGSRTLSSEYIDRLKNAGIHFRFFSRISLFKNLTIGRRMHHKIVVADGHQALIGGINISDKYYKLEDEEPWLDFAILIKGEVCEKIEKICDSIQEKRYRHKHIHKPLSKSLQHPMPINIRQNDWLRNKRQIFHSYNMAIRNAEKSIVLFASYFLPGLRLRRALESAANRGVQITIVVAGMSDIPPLLNATPYLYNWLLENNIRIYEWKRSIFHAKLAIIDDEWMTIGSFNLNHLSVYASIELNVDILNKHFAKKSRLILDELIANGCEEITSKRKRSLLTKIREAVAYFLGRTLIKTITFFPNFRNYYSKVVD